MSDPIYNEILKEYDITQEHWDTGKNFDLNGQKGKIICTDEDDRSMIAFEDGGVIIEKISDLKEEI